MDIDRPLILIRGGGDLATGVAARLHRSGFAVLVTEIPQPLAVRRLVALAEAVFAGAVKIEDLTGRRAENLEEAVQFLKSGDIPVLVDPTAECRSDLNFLALIDGRMTKEPPDMGIDSAPFVVGLGPGFVAGENCHAVIETNRGHHMGRVYWAGSAERDTAVPEMVSGHDVDRVLRAPVSGQVRVGTKLGSLLKQGEQIAIVGDQSFPAPFDGALRGLIHDGVDVENGTKIGDLDPRGEVSLCYEISDKSLAVGGGVLEALLSSTEIRSRLAGSSASD